MEAQEGPFLIDQNFEVIVLKKVGYGIYQKTVCWLLALIFIADGM
jgi:hypothetical protein